VRSAAPGLAHSDGGVGHHHLRREAVERGVEQVQRRGVAVQADVTGAALVDQARDGALVERDGDVGRVLFVHPRSVVPGRCRVLAGMCRSVKSPAIGPARTSGAPVTISRVRDHAVRPQTATEIEHAPELAPVVGGTIRTKALSCGPMGADNAVTK
jgi:hypothetical protein